MRTKNLVIRGALGVFAAGPCASGAVVWQDDFTRGTDPTTLNPYHFAGGAAGDDYGAVTGATVSVTGGRAVVTDTSTSVFMSTGVAANQWAGFSSAAGNQVTFSVDLKVNALSGVSSPSVSVPRFAITQNNVEVLTAGFAVANVDAEAGNDLFFYATPNSVAVLPGAAGAVGLTGGAWAPGFDFGDYDATTAENNDSNGHFYRLVLTFTQGSTAVTGSLTNLDVPAESVTFDRTLAANFSMTNSGSSNFKLLTGQGGSSAYEFDNLSVDTVVPEPGTVALVGVGVAGMLGRRRRRA